MTIDLHGASRSHSKYIKIQNPLTTRAKNNHEMKCVYLDHG